MNNFDQEIVARTALGEARGEGDVAMQAVMWTIVNRFTAKKWFSGHSLADTALKKLQYSCWLQNDPNYAIITAITSAMGIYNNAMKWAAAVIAGMTPDPTLGATHYYDDSIAPPFWTKNATLTQKIGRLNFFKGVD